MCVKEFEHNAKIIFITFQEECAKEKELELLALFLALFERCL